jgi:SRSO17 transposase
MIDGLHQRGALPFRWVTGDEHFGNTPVLLDRIADAGLWYFMEVPHNVRVWRARPATAVPPATGKKGHPYTRLRLAPGAPAPVRVDAPAASLPADAWRPALIHEGSKGPLVAAVACRRVVAVRDGLPGPDVWLVLRRGLGEAAELKTYLCNAPAAIPETTLIWLLGMRWPVEQAIKESKDELGLDHYEVRGWVGWRHHLTLTLLAHHFLMRLRCRLGGDRPGGDGPAGARAVGGDAAGPATGRRDDPGAGAGDPAAQLRGGALPSQADPAPVAGYLLSQVTL